MLLCTLQGANFLLYIFLSHSLLVGLLVNMSSLDGKDFLRVRGMPSSWVAKGPPGVRLMMGAVLLLLASCYLSLRREWRIMLAFNSCCNLGVLTATAYHHDTRLHYHLPTSILFDPLLCTVFESIIYIEETIEDSEW